MSTEPKFTPGPWVSFYQHKYDEWHVSLPIAGSSMKLALCPDGIQSENREADARLIAAAPDLFEALRAEYEAELAFDAADEITHRADAEDWLNDPTGSLHVNEAYERARKLAEKAKAMRSAALSKATGATEVRK